MGFLDRFFSKPLNKDKFANLVLEGIRRAGETKRITYDKDTFSFRGEDGQVANLANIYQDYCAADKSVRSQVVQRFVRTWFIHLQEMPAAFDDARPDILPAIHFRSYYDINRLRGQLEFGKAADWVYFPIAEHFALGLAYDLPHARRLITQSDLDEWGVSQYEALEVARQNLAQLDHPFIGPAEGDGVYVSASKDGYDASRLLSLEVIRQFHLAGAPAAMVPNRETLIVTGAEDLEGLKALLALAKEAFGEPRFISGIALRLDGDEWTAWLPGPDHPLYWDFRTIRTQTLGQDYSEQKEVLDQLNQKTGEDVFVASFSGMEKDGHLFSYCVWSKGVLTLLPHTDLIALVDPANKKHVLAEWDQVAAVVGEMMEPMDMYPVRFKVGEFPSEGQLAAIGGSNNVNRIDGGAPD